MGAPNKLRAEGECHGNTFASCEVTTFATHGLSCVHSQGCYHHHSSLNDIIHRALGASRHLEFHLDLNPVESLVKLLVWDAPSYSRVASQEAGAVADQAERRKSDKYSNMDPNMYLFVPVVIETSGVFGKQTLSFLKDMFIRCQGKLSPFHFNFS